MRKRSVWRDLKLIGIYAAIATLSVDLAFAQQRNTFGPNIRNRPTVSPFLSLTDTGNNNGNGNGDYGLNYYNIVKPQNRSRQVANQFQNELRGVESGLQKPQGGRSTSISLVPITTGRMPLTGHPTSRGSLEGYFGGGNSQGAGGGGSGTGGGGSGTGGSGNGSRRN